MKFGLENVETNGFGRILTCARGGRAHVRRMVLFDRDGASGGRAEVVELVRRARESGP